MGEALWPYERVLTDLRRKITSGELTGQLPSRLVLADNYGVSHMTVQRAIDTLKDEGLVHSVRGLGVFAVTPRNPGGNESSDT
jgi:DNA-binding GntR family transcriptional regulator